MSACCVGHKTQDTNGMASRIVDWLRACSSTCVATEVVEPSPAKDKARQRTFVARRIGYAPPPHHRLRASSSTSEMQTAQQRRRASAPVRLQLPAVDSQYHSFPVSPGTTRIVGRLVAFSDKTRPRRVASVPL